MSKVKIVLDRKGVRELLRSPEMMAVLEEQAAHVAQRAGGGYEMSRYTGQNRANVSVHPGTEEAWRDCMENNTLVKALGGGR